MIKRIFLGSLFLLLLDACVKYECPGFVEDEYYSTPYSLGDFMLFADGLDTLKFIINDFYQTAPSSGKVPFMVESFCDGESWFHTDTNAQYGYQIFESYGAGLGLKLIPNDSFGLSTYTRTGDNRTTVVFRTEITIDSIEYFNVYDLQLDSGRQSHEVQVYRVLWNNDFGIIQFHDRFFAKTWTLVK